MASDYQKMSKNGFIMYYRFFPKPQMFVSYGGNPLQVLAKDPSYKVNDKYPFDSKFNYDVSVVKLSETVFDTIEMLCSEKEYCVAAMLGNHFYESFTRLDDEFRDTGRHVLGIPLWLSVLRLVSAWEAKHPKFKLHIGTPLYFLSVAYFLTRNYDPGFIYLIQSIDGDIELGKHCPDFHYPEKEPANLTICLVDNPSNYMSDFIVSPLRVQLAGSIQRYNDLFGKESRLSGIQEFDLKFLQKRDTGFLKIELIKQLFVLELIRLLQLRNIDLKIDNQFFQMLLLNRLFSIALVVDKLLYANYPSQTNVSNKEPQMYDCVISYATAHGMARADIDSLEHDRHNLQGALEFLLEKRSQGNWNNVTREMFPILIAHAVRNTSAHKIHAVEVLYSKFKEILQSLMEAVFIIVGQIPEQKTQQK